MKFGSKDLMRIRDIQLKSGGDWINQMVLSKKMADSIDLPGKAKARGYAAQELLGPHSPIAYIFFERAYELGGDDVQSEASVNPVNDLEEFYKNIPELHLPGSRKKNKKIFKESEKKTKPAILESMGRINLVKGAGPRFNIRETPMGVIEVWKDPRTKNPKLIWTVNSEPIHSIEEKRDFIYDGKRIEWKMIDYIDTLDLGNLVPLYGKNLMIFSYS